MNYLTTPRSIKKELKDDYYDSKPVVMDVPKMLMSMSISIDIPKASQVLANSFMALNDLQKQHQPSESSSRCFHTTVTIQPPKTGNPIIIVQNVLLDSGATNSFLHRDVVHAAGLAPIKVPAKTFESATGQRTAHDEKVTCELHLGGWPIRVWAYVDDSNVRRRMIVGEDNLDIFGITHKRIGKGADRRQQVTVTPNQNGQRTKHYVVAQDPAHVAPLAYAARAGDPRAAVLRRTVTIPQYHAQQKRERARIDKQAKRRKEACKNWVYPDVY